MLQGESRYRSPEPQIELRLPTGTSHRFVSAALHKLAAEVELATHEFDGKDKYRKEKTVVIDECAIGHPPSATPGWGEDSREIALGATLAPKAPELSPYSADGRLPHPVFSPYS